MDNQDIRTLQILEEIEKDYAPSQRELAKELNISLGLVNSFIKRLVKKGYFKITAIPRNRVKYILTPKGATEKTRLTYNYIQHSYKFYRDARLKLGRHFNDLEAQGVHSIVFYGANDIAEIAYISLQDTSIDIVAVVDDDKIGEKFMGTVVKDSSMLDSLSFDKILITSATNSNATLEKILARGISRKKTVMIA